MLNNRKIKVFVKYMDSTEGMLNNRKIKVFVKYMDRRH